MPNDLSQALGSPSILQITVWLYIHSVMGVPISEPDVGIAPLFYKLQFDYIYLKSLLLIN